MDNWRKTLLWAIAGSCVYGGLQFGLFLLMMAYPGPLKTVYTIFPFSFYLIIPLISILILSAHSMGRYHQVFTMSIIDLYPLAGSLIVSGWLYLYSASGKAGFDYGITEAVAKMFALFALIIAAFLALKYAILFICRARLGRKR